MFPLLSSINSSPTSIQVVETKDLWIHIGWRVKNMICPLTPFIFLLFLKFLKDLQHASSWCNSIASSSNFSFHAHPHKMANIFWNMQFFWISCAFLVALKSMFVPSSHPTSAMINSIYASNNIFAFRYKSFGISWYHHLASLESMFVPSPHPTSTMIDSIYASKLVFSIRIWNQVNFLYL